MADAKLSALPAGAAIGNTDLFYSDQAGVSVSQTGLALATFIAGGSITVNATGVIGGTTKHVAFDNAGTFGEAANFTIESGNPNVTAGNTYRYDGQEFLRGDVGGFDSWYAGNSGTNATGFANTTFGWNALSFGPNTGAFNTAMGFAAMQSNTSGQNNTAIGAACMFNNQTGIDNTCLGNSAGVSITSGSVNIVIGVACEPASGTASGQLSIGNYIYGTGLTGTGATISTGKIGIGVKAPVAELDVAGSVKTNAVLVSALPAPGNAGARNFVTDALGPAFGVPVVGLGGVPVPVYDDGTQWVVG